MCKRKQKRGGEKTSFRPALRVGLPSISALFWLARHLRILLLLPDAFFPTRLTETKPENSSPGFSGIRDVDSRQLYKDQRETSYDCAAHTVNMESQDRLWCACLRCVRGRRISNDTLAAGHSRHHRHTTTVARKQRWRRLGTRKNNNNSLFGG